MGSFFFRLCRTFSTCSCSAPETKRPTMAELDAIAEIRGGYLKLTESFSSAPRTREESKQLLNRFKNVLSESFEPIATAVRKDFNKPELEFYIAEFSQAIAEMANIISNLDTMLESVAPSHLPVSFSTLSIDVEKIALGTVLIISPFNYPLILSISPLVGAIAAGNNVVLKLPFDQLPNFCSALTKIIHSTFPPESVMVVNGGIPESQYLLNDCKFDKIFFTGSTNVGKIVYKSASDKLTPVVLELGGKSPVFVTKNVSTGSLDVLVDRLLWGKFCNAGQTCVAPDYVLIESSVYGKFMEKLLKAFDTFSKVNKDSDFAHIINERGFDRLVNLIKETKGEVHGGEYTKEELFIAPTIVTNISWTDVLMSQEIFGPILPIIKYDTPLEEAVKNVIKYHDCPLAAYLFSSSEKDLQVLKTNLRSGSILVNETLMSAGCFVTPFGGIGNSGFGNYHSKWTVDTFTHERAILKQPLWAESILSARYFPYTPEKLKMFKLLSKVPEIPVQLLKQIVIYCSIFLLGWYLGKMSYN